MSANDFKNQFWTVTAGDLSKKRAKLAAPRKAAKPAAGAAKIGPITKISRSARC